MFPLNGAANSSALKDCGWSHVAKPLLLFWRIWKIGLLCKIIQFSNVDLSDIKTLQRPNQWCF